MNFFTEIEGLALPFGVTITSEGRPTRYAPGAFARVIKAKGFSLKSRNPLRPALASQEKGNLDVRETAEGLRFSAWVAPDARIIRLIEAGTYGPLCVSCWRAHVEQQNEVFVVTDVEEAAIFLVDPIDDPCFPTACCRVVR